MSEHAFTPLYSPRHNPASEPVAVRWDHTRPGTGAPCKMEFACTLWHAHEGRPEVGVVETEPLTVIERLECPSCGRAGYVRDGEWYDD